MLFMTAQCADFISASKNSGLTDFLGIGVSEGIIGIAGMISGVIQIIQVYK